MCMTPSASASLHCFPWTGSISWNQSSSRRPARGWPATSPPRESPQLRAQGSALALWGSSASRSSHADLVHAADLGEQPDVTQRPGRRWPRAPGAAGAGRDLKLPTELLDPEAVAVQVDEPAHLGRGWSSSQAKNTLVP